MVMSWVAVYGCIYWCYIIRRIVCLIQWCCMKDPRLIQAKIRFYTFVFVNTAEIAWFGFGNFIFFNKMLEKNPDRSDDHLWYIMLAIVIFGYL